MENDLHNINAPATKADLNVEFGKFEEKLDKKLDERLSEQANVILEAVGELMEKKLDEKFDPVISKLDCIMKGVEASNRRIPSAPSSSAGTQTNCRSTRPAYQRSRLHQHNSVSFICRLKASRIETSQ